VRSLRQGPHLLPARRRGEPKLCRALIFLSLKRTTQSRSIDLRLRQRRNSLRHGHRKHVGAAIMRLPILFEENVGQAQETVRWIVSKPAGAVWFFDDHVLFRFQTPEVANTAGTVPRSLDEEVLQRLKSERR